jgi:hypothetical protein
MLGSCDALDVRGLVLHRMTSGRRPTRRGDSRSGLGDVAPSKPRGHLRPVDRGGLREVLTQVRGQRVAGRETSFTGCR